VHAAAQHRPMGHAAGVRYANNPQFVLPVWINGHKVQAVRDTGNMTHTIVNSQLVRADDYTGGVMACHGIFESQGVCYNVPLAKVRMYAPGLGCEQEISVVVGSWDTGPNIDCLLGNQTFLTYAELKDVVKSNRSLVPGTNRHENDLSRNNDEFTASYDSSCQGAKREHDYKRRQPLDEIETGLSGRRKADTTRHDPVKQSAYSDPERRKTNGALNAASARNSRHGDTAGHDTTDCGQETNDQRHEHKRNHSTDDMLDAGGTDPKLNEPCQTFGGQHAMVTMTGRGNVNSRKRADGYGASRDRCENDSASLATGNAPAVDDPGGGMHRERRRANKAAAVRNRLTL